MNVELKITSDDLEFTGQISLEMAGRIIEYIATEEDRRRLKALRERPRPSN